MIKSNPGETRMSAPTDTSLEKLEVLLVSLFSRPEFVRLLRRNTTALCSPDDLATSHSYQHYVHEAVALMSRMGTRDAIYDIAARERPARADEIRALRRELESRDSATPTQTEPVQQQPAAPTRLGQWDIDRELGRGAYGIVYLASGPPGEAAVKVLISRADPTVDEERQRRFRRGPHALTKLGANGGHLNIVKLLDAEGLTHQPAWYATEYVSGRPLNKSIRQMMEQSLAERLHFFRGIVEAVAFAHSRDVFHRDLTPRNIMIDKTSSPWRPVLVDFDLARDVEDQSITRLQPLEGSVEFVPPEQRERWTGGDEYTWTRPDDQARDLWSLGTLLDLLLVGSLSGHPTRQQERREERGVPHEVDDLVKALLAPNASARPKSAEEILARYDATRSRARSPTTTAPEGTQTGGERRPAVFRSPAHRFFNSVAFHPFAREVTTCPLRVCLLRRGGLPRGTGFLVGPRHVLTMYMSVDDLVRDSSEAEYMDLLFDFSGEAAEAKRVTLDPVSPVEWWSPCAQYDLSGQRPFPTEAELNAAILVLNDPIGDRPAGGSGAPRGWIDLARSPTGAGRPGLVMIHHMLARPCQTEISLEQTATLQGNRLHYSLHSGAGSAGAPVFDGDWNVLAMHQASRERGIREGVPTSLIQKALREVGLVLPPPPPRR